MWRYVLERAVLRLGCLLAAVLLLAALFAAAPHFVLSTHIP